jgi:hypothetical protein
METSIKLTSTLKDLIDLGIIKSSQIDTWNRRLTKGDEKNQDIMTQERANMAIAFYLGGEYPFAPVTNGEELHSHRSETVNGKRIAFGLKASEKALLKYGISRRMIEKTFSHLKEAGHMLSTKGICTNNAHVRHGILKSVARDLEMRPLIPVSTDSPE